MPKRTDIKSVLIIGAGPIVIGQACEFDYSGAQACKALRAEGYRVILVNSNPATIMTDPEMADVTYIEPVNWQMLEAIIARERPDTLLPTMGGQTGLNCALDLVRHGVLQKYGVEMIGASSEAIDKAEDREKFKQAMARIGLACPRSTLAHSLEEALQVQAAIGFPAVIRPSFTLGGSGGGIAYNREEFVAICERGLEASPTHELLIEESVIGWKEFEMEVVRDRKDNCIIVCSIENVDPMGVHTGDSITVAPAQTLTDKEYQVMRDAAVACIRAIGVDTGGSNIQFAVHPETGRLVVIEMNPRVSRSSALASKATGFPIAKIAAKLAVGYTLDEIPNDITRETPACFEPTIDYVVVKVPRFTFEKFPKAKDILTPQMKSVGEAMAIGRTFKEALQKAIRSLEIDSYGFEEKVLPDESGREQQLRLVREKLAIANAQRLWYLADAFRLEMPGDEIYQLTKIDPWFLEHIRQIVGSEREIREQRDKKQALTEDFFRPAKQMGFSDRRLAALLGRTEEEMRTLRLQAGVRAVFRAVDTCGAEFAAYTPYLYSTYEGEDESNTTAKKKIMILGGGPNRIGQGIEFDYCCVHAAFALKEDGYETIMVNCNPETVSTDYDTSDKLYFEPLTLEDVLNIYDQEQPEGVFVQFGGQTPLNLASGLKTAGVPILGTQPESIETAEDRQLFATMLNKLGLRQTPNGSATSTEKAVAIAKKIGYPVLVRPSFVLGGRAMELVYNEGDLQRYMTSAIEVTPDRPVLIDRFLEDAIEVDVDCISDGETTVIGAIMEHIEEAGIHSGDSACVIPTFSLSQNVLDEISTATKSMARQLNVRGLMNVQFAVKGDDVYVLEVNPRASRTVPFVSKAIGVPLAKLAAKVMTGESLRELGFTREIVPKHFSVKEAVFPFLRYEGVDISLGPEMKSTGEVMGMDVDLGLAYAKSQMAAPPPLPKTGKVFVSVKDAEKEAVIPVAREFVKLGFEIISTSGTARALSKAKIKVTKVFKIHEGRPNVLDRIKNGDINFIINTPSGKIPREHEVVIRNAALAAKIPIMTTVRAALASANGIRSLQKRKVQVRSLQEYHASRR